MFIVKVNDLYLSDYDGDIFYSNSIILEEANLSKFQSDATILNSEEIARSISEQINGEYFELLINKK